MLRHRAGTRRRIPFAVLAMAAVLPLTMPAPAMGQTAQRDEAIANPQEAPSRDVVSPIEFARLLQRMEALEQENARQADLIARMQRELDLHRMAINRQGQSLAAGPMGAGAGVAAPPVARQGDVSPPAAAPQAAQVTAPPATASTAPATTPPSSSAQASAEDRPESRRAVDQALVDLGSVLLPRDTLQIEASYQYDRVLNDRVNIFGFSIFDAIVIGTIRFDQIGRDINTLTLGARYGLLDRVQLELRAPVVYRSDREVKGVGTPTTTERDYNGYGLGDVEGSIAWQPISNEGWRPATILRLRGRAPTGESPFEVDRGLDEDGFTQILEAPTGSGFWSVGAGATLVWRQDPAVFFMSGGYSANLESDDTNGFGSIDPGDSYDFSAGFNLALNERASMNVSFSQQYTERTVRNGSELPGSSSMDARLGLGASIGLTDRTSVVLSAQAGLTQESPDYTVSVTVPFTFQGVAEGLFGGR